MNNKGLGKISSNKIAPSLLTKTVIALMVVMVFLSSQAVAGEFFLWDTYSNEEIVNAIFKAEGGYKADYLFGIRSIPYKDYNDAKKICLNSVRNGRARWVKAGKPYDLIIHIGLRYCPPKAHKLNSNWVSNVKMFLGRAK